MPQISTIRQTNRYFCSMSFIQTDTYQVRSYETDANGRLSVPTLMNWMQESANRNALDYGIGMADLAHQGFGWVLMRFRLHINQYPVYNDIVTVKTYPTFVEKFFIYRDFQVLAADGTVLATASSVWLTFAMDKRTMVPLPPFIRAVDPPAGVVPQEKLSLKLESVAMGDCVTQEQPVRFYHLDQNQHTNNVCYVQWLLESVAPDTLRHHRLTELDLFFRAESHWQDTLRIGARSLDLAAPHRAGRFGKRTPDRPERVAIAVGE